MTHDERIERVVEQAMARGGRMTRWEYLQVRWVAFRRHGTIFVRRQHGGEW